MVLCLCLLLLSPLWRHLRRTCAGAALSRFRHNNPVRGGRIERKAASDYPQELLDLFDEYQHGDISRRTFLERAGKFAVGGLTVAAIFEGLRPNYAWAQQVKPDDKRIKVGYEVVQSPAGNGSLAWPRCRTAW